ncbi:Hemerythrin HHE cation binding domain-containing protein [Colwellia chukchiensis]|uniref:Hemerythrin HHE cation binding domain-containing protein n=1 Tax=Colwellia chukchiensis TaxID=641665 RepID=A0A1H7NPG0_9GAMM|nr:hemerythrin domain-containing protein [Colwellia chukchiensis]SEL24857.1 Hemerythrin HHE cation binding domain-containing protein [Colwellia chukchiensis]
MMTSIPEFMTAKHRECDEVFIAAENAITDNNWPLAAQTFNQFAKELELHLQAEEEILFPEFEQATGITQGPTQVMRGEHQQMRALVADLTQALNEKNQQAYIGASETLMVLMQQHNMKEEMMLYPMTQQRVPAPEALLTRVTEHCTGTDISD